MATFEVRFLGCKVSHLDAQDVRERLLATGMWSARRRRRRRVVNTCCVTNEARPKSRQAAARAARTHQRVYVTGCAANLDGDALRRASGERRRRSDAAARRRPAFVAGDVGAIGCVQAMPGSSGSVRS